MPAVLKHAYAVLEHVIAVLDDAYTLLEYSYVALCAGMKILAWFLLEGKSYSHT